MKNRLPPFFRRWTSRHLLLGVLLGIAISLLLVRNPQPYNATKGLYAGKFSLLSNPDNGVNAHSNPSPSSAYESIILMHKHADSDVHIDPQVSVQGGDEFQRLDENPYKRTTEDPVSTFSVDVDTSSYSYTRRLLQNGRLPPPDAVKIEEMINYFDYQYPVPDDKEKPFEPTVMISDSPWHTGRKLMHIGIKGYDLEPTERPFSNLVFLIDVSGSMNTSDKLPLAKKSIEMLLQTLLPEDYVSIVTYASQLKEALSPTPVAQKQKILSVLNSLQASGATWGTGGIELAYKVAESNFDKDAINRIILVTDGDFNIGLTDGDALSKYIEKKRQTGIFLSVLGFGMGNYKDTTMKALANHGNGVAAYIDSLEEANKVMVKESQSTIFPIAKDVKIQIEYNPAKVAEYRLVGYEKRLLNREDFNNDKVDAGDIGSGHSVTAIYEFTPAASEEEAALDKLRYERSSDSKPADSTNSSSNMGDEYGFLKIRYKLPDETTSKLIATPISSANEADNMIKTDIHNASLLREFKFASAVASYAQLLKGGKNTGDLSYDDVLAMREDNMGEDQYGFRKEFCQLVRTAKRLAEEQKIY